MLQLFRKNTLLNNLLLLAYAFAIRSIVWVREMPQPDQDGGLLYKWLLAGLDPGSTWVQILFTLILFLQAAYLNRIFGINRLTKENSLFPGAFFLLLSSISVHFLGMQALIPANLMLWMALHDLFRASREGEQAGELFNTGFFAALASLFFPPYILFFLFFQLAAGILRTFRLRERLQMLTGYLIPYLLIGVGGFVWGDLSQLWGQQWATLAVYLGAASYFSVWSLLAVSIMAILLVVVLLGYSGLMYRNNIQAKRKIGVLYWMLLIPSICIFLQRQVYWSDALVLAPALGALTGALMLRLKNHFLAELFHLLLVATMLFLQYYFTA